MEEIRCDVIVVGAGLAGLSAVYALRAYGHYVAVVEANARVGGRAERRTLGCGLSV